ncbi:Glycylpeptide N-tetradecanoyltransferase 2, partial [Galemys pyrenaicus]
PAQPRWRRIASLQPASRAWSWTTRTHGDNEEESEHAKGSPVGDLSAKKKKKKQKRKKEKPNSGGTKSDSASDSQEMKIQQPSKNPTFPMQKLQDIQRAMELLSACQGTARNIDEAAKHRYQFWDTQPVPKLNEVITSHGATEADKDNVRQEPYSLPQGFMWDTLDLGNAETLLNENYVEDDDNMFRFDYSPEFLLWALCPPGWLLQWHCGVRVSSNKKLVRFISAIPANIRIYDSVKKMVEINFLCVHKKLRSKRSLKAAYSFYNIHMETPLLDLMDDTLIIAKLKGFDVFNALDLMENKTFLENSSL